ncbi:MAG: hypothetical protein M0C28_24835 [Candidatus Moduliflexus flocculans]|nr:hypothetical protein [Candidatus Moduliflexus flocculans]
MASFTSGAARTVAIERGLYPVGAEIAHPLHYVDVAADGSDPVVSPYPGTRVPPGQGNPLSVQMESVPPEPVPARNQGRGRAGLRQR